MAVFAYVARSAQGEVVREEMEAENEQILRRLLREKGYWVTTVRQKSRGKAAAGGGNEAKRPFLASSKVKLNHLAVFCRQLAVLINAGVSLVRSLSVLDRQPTSIFQFDVPLSASRNPLVLASVLFFRPTNTPAWNLTPKFVSPPRSEPLGRIEHLCYIGKALC